MPSPRRKRPAKTQQNLGPGVGSKISEEELVKAANVWLELESKSESGKVSALAVGRRLGKSVAPEWLDSTRFQMTVELVRFNQKVAALKGTQEVSALVGRVIDLGLVEAHRRLVQEPHAIPDTVLFGDVLHKLLKMQQELTSSTKTIRAGDVYQIIAKEINLLADPKDQEAMRAQIMGSIQAGMNLLSSGGSQPSNAEESVVDVDSVALDPATPDPLSVASESLVHMGGSGGRVSAPGGPALGAETEEQLWSDPALD